MRVPIKDAAADSRKGDITANTRRLTNAGAMLVQRRRRWTNIAPTLVERLVFADITPAGGTKQKLPLIVIQKGL